LASSTSWTATGPSEQSGWRRCSTRTGS
jgi:hypothetical protein